MTLKVQCNCGVKYAIDVTEANLANPVQLVCQSCGADNSDAVNYIIRQQFAGQTQTQPSLSPTRPTAPPPPATPVAGAGSPKAQLRVAAPVHSAGPAEPVDTGAPSVRPCLGHPGQFVSGQCLVCKKPMCPNCMEQFGYVCSVYCQSQAESQGIDVPAYLNQKTVVQSRSRGRARLIGATVALLVVTLLGALGWYWLVGSRPKVVFSVKLSENNYNTFCRLMGTDQALLRHGNRLARYDVIEKKEVWSVPVVTEKDLSEAAAEALAEQKKWKAEMQALFRNQAPSPPASFAESAGRRKPTEADEISELAEGMEEQLLSRVRIHVSGEDICLIYPRKIVRLDWATGQAKGETALPGKLVRVEATDHSLLAICDNEPGRKILTHLKLASGETRTAEITPPAPERPGTPRTVPGTTPARFAAAMVEDEDLGIEEGIRVIPFRTELVNAGRNIAQLTVKLVEKKIVSYKTMKEPTGSSALENVSAANSMAVANEVFNEWQKERTGGVRREDESLYRVTIDRFLAEGSSPWTGEVSGPPKLYCLPSVDVLVAGKSLVVFDKSNKKLWESRLNYPVADSPLLDDGMWDMDSLDRSAPCLERENTLYFFDQGVLTAFEIASGTVQWRLPSIGVSRLQFDNKGMLYVSTTDASPDKIQYSDQVDIMQKTAPVILKVDPKTGKTLWKAERTGQTCYFSGKFVYATESSAGETDPFRITAAVKPHLRIYRLKPGNGRVIWEHYTGKSPTSIDFYENTIQVVFHDEMRILRFMSF